MRISNVLFGLFMALLLTSCAKVDKLVHDGNYDKALDVALKHARGKKIKKIKTEYVQFAEEAFKKATTRDMNRIAALREKNSIDSWKKIHRIAKSMLERQGKIEPYLPLESRDGYKASFSFVQAEVIRRDAVAFLSDALYDRGMAALEHGRQGNKAAARDAYKDFKSARSYNKEFKQVTARMHESRELGTNYILVKMDNRTTSFIPHQVERTLMQFNRSGRVSEWNVFHNTPRDNRTYDFVSNVLVNRIDVTPERVQERIHYFNKEIRTTEYETDRYGNFILDTAGNKIPVIVIERVRATVFEINQEKDARVDMAIEIRDRANRVVDRRNFFNSESSFDNDACRIDGDRRAVEGRWLELGAPLPFPTDDEMVVLAAESLKDEIGRYMASITF